MAVSRVALVTVVSSGFGQATATLLAGHGFRVFGTSRVPAPNPAGTCEMFPLDVCSLPAFDEKAEPVDEGTHSTKSLSRKEQ